MTPVGLQLFTFCPFCQRSGILEPDIIYSAKESPAPSLSGVLIRECGCATWPRFKVNLDHGVWQLAN